MSFEPVFTLTAKSVLLQDDELWVRDGSRAILEAWNPDETSEAGRRTSWPRLPASINEFVLQALGPPWWTATDELESKGIEDSTVRSVLTGDKSPGQAEAL